MWYTSHPDPGSSIKCRVCLLLVREMGYFQIQVTSFSDQSSEHGVKLEQGPINLAIWQHWYQKDRSLCRRTGQKMLYFIQPCHYCFCLTEIHFQNIIIKRHYEGGKKQTDLRLVACGWLRPYPSWQQCAVVWRHHPAAWVHRIPEIWIEQHTM